MLLKDKWTTNHPSYSKHSILWDFFMTLVMLPRSLLVSFSLLLCAVQSTSLLSIIFFKILWLWIPTTFLHHKLCYFINFLKILMSKTCLVWERRLCWCFFVWEYELHQSNVCVPRQALYACLYDATITHSWIDRPNE